MKTCMFPITIKSERRLDTILGRFSKHRLVPCGKCRFCRLKLLRAEVSRQYCEFLHKGCGIFLTLTNDYVSFPDRPDVLVKKELQDFIKRLRFKFSHLTLSHCSTGEYSSELNDNGSSKHAHYHCSIFGLSLDHILDLKFLKRNRRGEAYYISDTFSKLWRYGYHTISSMSPFTIRYVLNYRMSKRENEAYYNSDGELIQPPFSLYSKRPALGLEWLKRNLDKTHVFIDGKRYFFSRYFQDKKLELLGQERSDVEKKRLINKMEIGFDQTKKQLSIAQYEQFIKKTNILKRRILK